MIKKLYLPFLMALVFALSSCSSKMGELSSDYFTTTPQVLEAVGVKDVLSKSLGSNNDMAMVNATLNALYQLRTADAISALRS